jgi:LPXTG-site transpeptidase (sortase) family protein
VHSAPDADPEIEEVHSEIVDERAQWQLRRAYSMTVSDLAIRTPVWLPSRQYWDAREWSLLEEQMQIGLLYGAVAYPHSSRPGAGPLVIAGHSSPPTERATESQYGSVFAHLPDVSIAEEIVLTDGEEKFRYAVTEMFIVASTDTSILDLTRLAPDTLTVITCYPVGTTRQRFVVRAKLLPNNE